MNWAWKNEIFFLQVGGGLELEVRKKCKCKVEERLRKKKGERERKEKKKKKKKRIFESGSVGGKKNKRWLCHLANQNLKNFYRL